MTDFLILTSICLGYAIAILFIAWLVVKSQNHGKGYDNEADADARYITKIRSNYIEGI